MSIPPRPGEPRILPRSWKILSSPGDIESIAAHPAVPRRGTWLAEGASMQSRWVFRNVSRLLALGLVTGLVMVGCAAGPDDDSTGDEELWDEGPPPGEDVGTTTSGVGKAPDFQLPFPCGQVWAGQTRTNHSPQNSVDFNRTNDIGDTVVASAAGTVTRVGNEGNTSYGRWIEIDHGSGYRSRYAHLSVQSVKLGQSVSQGQKIGEVGSTGGSSGPHLHYEERKDGVAIRPVFDGKTALFFGEKSYTSKNKCSGGGGGGGNGGGGVIGTVNTNGASLSVRSQPTTNSDKVGSVEDGDKVTITCQIHGSSVSGTYGTTTLWDFIGTGYVSDAYVSTGSDGQVAPTCK